MRFSQRIYGVENEYGVGLKNAERGVFFNPYQLVLNNMIRACEHAVYSEYPKPSRVWHSNGSSSYIDTGDHPEHATAECRSVRDAVAYNKAGEALIIKTLPDILDGGSSLLLFKNNLGVNHRGEIVGEFGCHENYSMGMQVWDKSLPPLLLPFLVTRQIIDGAGWWDENGHYVRPSERSPSGL